MGPHFFKCGKMDERFQWTSGFNSFNGAALFQVRKVLALKTEHPATLIASMGPHFFKCGKARFLMVSSLALRASMGPHFFKCGKVAPPNLSVPDFFQLQWGRTFSSAERNAPPRTATHPNHASMGPHFFKCGKKVIMWNRSADITMLQWGRTFSSAERMLFFETDAVL